MEQILGTISDLFNTYGFWQGFVIILTIFIVNLIKMPILTYAKKYAEKNNVDKSVITKYIAILPLIISSILTLLAMMALCKFDLKDFSWKIYLAQVSVNTMASISIYEVLKKQLESYVSKKKSIAEEEKMEKREPVAEKNDDDKLIGM